MYWDANNLYGWSISQYLPYGKNLNGIIQKILTQKKKFWNSNLMLLKDNFFEVDLEYPQHMHDLYNEYCLAPEHLNIKESMLSAEAKNMLQGRKFTVSTKSTPNLFN